MNLQISDDNRPLSKTGHRCGASPSTARPSARLTHRHLGHGPSGRRTCHGERTVLAQRQATPKSNELTAFRGKLRRFAIGQPALPR
ncbi:hypothetical protein PUR49_03485 [Streptomyces sp. BE147]|uniref:hypothetical protein n=1 Tax=Streptomyces sp. BE147 TaxID=3002524 RepID=UPI002E75DCC3|nr:hypothetical protein [Streptomyces sp. BE147]MEE1735587.1 hypothetical protein [Streptomyces sp. BE147]